MFNKLINSRKEFRVAPIFIELLIKASIQGVCALGPKIPELLLRRFLWHGDDIDLFCVIFS